MESMNLDSQAATEASVNAPSLVAVYDETGKAVHVPGADVAYWLSRGFTQLPFDPTTAASELKVLLDAAETAISAFVDGVLADGVIDPADQAAKATAELAMGAVERAFNRLLLSLERKYPMREPEPATLYEQLALVGNQRLTLPELAQLAEVPADVTYEWVERQVDPNQVGLFLARKGWAMTPGGA